MLAIRAARLFDGVHPKLIEQPLILVEDGRITAVESGGVTPPEGAEVVDLGDATLLPGLIDVHVHLGFDAGPDPVARMNGDDDHTLLLRMAKHAQHALRAGVTTVRDLGDRNFLGVTLREWYRSGGEAGPEVLAAGPPVTVTGGHCYFMNGEVDGELGIRRGVRERVKRGVDVIKVMATGGHMTPGTNPLAAQFTVPELCAAVEEAHRLGKKLTAHAHATVGIELATEAGVDGIEHCSFQVADGIHAEDVLIERIAAQRIAVAPTIGRPPWSPVPPAFAARREERMRLLERMHRAGVKLVTGTDAGINGVPHDSAIWSVRTFAQAGLSNVEALRTATSVAADACGIGERKGTLAPGKEADILAVGGDLLANLNALDDMRAVFRAGTP
ncbi:MAG: amidohydrolase family protein, partial [Dehalococcoidia bacterium]